MNFAAVDIGTNSVRLLVARLDGGCLHPAERALTTTRLGAGLMELGMLSVEGKLATVNAVREYVNLAGSLGATTVVVFGTSALREARDGSLFARQLEKETGCIVEILSTTEEAVYSYHGATRSLPQIEAPLVFDLGGGSCELAWQEGAMLQSASLKIGAVYLTDSFFRHDPPLAAETAMAAAHIREHLAKLCPVGRPVIGVGGTVTTLAALSLELYPYDPEVVHGYRLTRKIIQGQLARMLALKMRERKTLPGMQKGRAQILPAGTLVVDELLASCKATSLTVSEGDILLGRLYALTSKA
jgi:exopolyphosphatase/guanosine-5'-triphosphate,3'-diphosphate pyrophosphatase